MLHYTNTVYLIGYIQLIFILYASLWFLLLSQYIISFFSFICPQYILYVYVLYMCIRVCICVLVPLRVCCGALWARSLRVKGKAPVDILKGIWRKYKDSKKPLQDQGGSSRGFAHIFDSSLPHTEAGRGPQGGWVHIVIITQILRGCNVCGARKHVCYTFFIIQEFIAPGCTGVVAFIRGSHHPA